MPDSEDMATRPKTESERDRSLSSIESSPEAEAEAEAEGEAGTEQFLQEHTAVQKRKGGRKPIYATSEERKQRNRQAQAAFRERRTEYIKQLEATIKHHEDSLHSLQQSHRSAADECLMLRYKNSLLERILLEKGIDVQAELNAKTDSPHYGPGHTPPAPSSAAQAPAVQRAIMNRHHQARRSMSGVKPKLDTGVPIMQPLSRDVSFSSKSPQLQPTPPSQTSSPTSGSQGFAVQGTMTPPVSDVSVQPRQPQPRSVGGPVRTGSAPRAQAGQPMLQSPGVPPGSAGSRPSSYYPSPFQSHIEQLEQEYDAQVDMIDDQDPSDHSAGPGPYPQTFPPQYSQRIHPQMGPSPVRGQAPAPDHPMTQAGEGHGAPFTTMGEMYASGDISSNDDQFGLWQSMTFPTQFSFPPSSMR